ncbi:phage baseplate assembly protein V [Pseudomonas anguilliseptica]|uniref:phage baseplate assembly protein V n=1 Tax=Pseudomonas anguilliseptica TaxID=53406 RepID=UPI00325C102D
MRPLKKLGDTVKRGISNLLARAVLTAVQQNKLQIIQVQILAGEPKDGVELFEPYGFSGAALPGAESVLGFIGGGRSHAIALVQTDRRYRPTDLQPGEVVVFNHEGTRVVLRNGHKVEVEAQAEVKVSTAKVTVLAADQVHITTGKAVLLGDLEVTGTTNFTGQVWANGVRIDDAHKHDLLGGGQTLEVSS